MACSSMNPKDLHCSIGGAKPVGRCVAQADLPQPVPLAAADPKATVRLNAAKRMLWVAQVRPASRSYQMVHTQVVFFFGGFRPAGFRTVDLSPKHSLPCCLCANNFLLWWRMTPQSAPVPHQIHEPPVSVAPTLKFGISTAFFACPRPVPPTAKRRRVGCFGP